MEKHKYTPYCEVMWWYIAGMVYNKYLENKKSVSLKGFWDAIGSGPRDLLGNIHVNLVIKCLDESKADDEVPILREELLKVKEWVNVKYKSNDQLQKRLTISPYTRKNKIVLSGFIDALRHKEYSVRKNAIEVLRSIGRDSPEVIQALLVAISDKNSSVRRSATKAIGDIGNDHPEVLKVLLATLNDKDSLVKCSAAEALGRIDRNSSEVIQSLLNVLSNGDPGSRGRSVQMLIKFGGERPEVTQGLIAALSDENFYVKSAAVEELRNITSNRSEVIQALLATLSDKDYKKSDVRRSAALALGTIGSDHPGVIQALLTILSDKESYERSAAAEALGKVGNRSPEIIQTLLAAISDKEPDVRWSAAEALVKLNSGHLGMLPIAVANEVKHNDTIELLSNILPAGISIECFAISNNPQWIENLLDSKELCCLMLQGNIAYINIQQKTQEISLTAEQTKTLLNVLKGQADKNGLSQLTHVYNGYLKTINDPHLSSQSSN